VIVLYLRPGSWSLPLFLHVLGATVLFGGTLALTVLAFAAWRGRERAAMLARLAFWTLLVVVLPTWILMRAGAQWIVDKEFPGNNPPGWVDVGFVVSEPGLVLLLALGVVAWLSARRGGTGRLAAALAVLAPVYLAALAVAWFAMSAKPGA
jgi:hypothetical protein